MQVPTDSKKAIRAEFCVFREQTVCINCNIDILTNYKEKFYKLGMNGSQVCNEGSLLVVLCFHNFYTHVYLCASGLS